MLPFSRSLSRSPLWFALCATLPTALASAQWRQVNTSPPPPGSRSPAMAASAAGSVVLFGGGTGSFSNPFSDETWVFGSDWTQVATSSGPSGRSEAAMVFDAQRGVFVLYGGWDSPFSIGFGIDETWEFDGASWSQAAPTASPGGLWKHTMCYDPVRGVTVLFGGASTGLVGATNGTWEYDGSTWTQSSAPGAPGPRENAAMCFDQALGQCVMFGGIDPLSGPLNQLWIYNGAWQQVAPIGPWPSARYGMSFEYDPVRQVALMHGGFDGIGNALSETWEFDGFNLAWTLRSSSGPSGGNFGAAFDPVGRRLVRFGGIGNIGDTWRYGALEASFGSGCAGSNGTPALAAAAPPRLGQVYSLQLANLVPTMPIGVFVLSFTSVPATPLDAVGLLGCNAYIAPDVLVSTNAAGGQAFWSGLIPNNTALLSVSLFSQGLSLDPGANPANLTVSNAHEGLIGF